MRRLQIITALLMMLGYAAHASAQGRMNGRVQDANGDAIKGATVRASNPNLSSTDIMATTDDKGRWVMLGLRVGAGWTFTAEAPGFIPERGVSAVRSVFGPVMVFTLERDPGAIPGALPKDIQQQLSSASQLRDQGRLDQAITAYQAIQTKNPKLTTVNLVLAGIYRQKSEQEKDPAARLALLRRASSAYDAVLQDDADNTRARAELDAVKASINELK